MADRAPLWLTNENPAWWRAWQPVGTLSELETADGMLRARLSGVGFVVLIGPDGPVGFRDHCPDGGAPLSAGVLREGALVCRHGTAYLLDSDHAGMRRDGGGNALRPLLVDVRYGLVWLAPGGSVAPLPDVPEWEAAGFTTVSIPAQDWNASAGQMADNFLDVAHFPFTHANSIGDPADREVAPYVVERQPWTFCVEHRHHAKTLKDSVEGTPDFATTVRTMRFVGTAPHHVYIRIRYEDTGTVLALCFFHQAIDLGRTRLYAVQIRNDIESGQSNEADATAFQLLVAGEDRDLLEQLEVKGIPADISTELHVRADRITVELRRMMLDLVALEP